jgi:hypothetical protein
MAEDQMGAAIGANVGDTPTRFLAVRAYTG